MSSAIIKAEEASVMEKSSPRLSISYKGLTWLTAAIILFLSASLLIDKLYQPSDFQIKRLALTGDKLHVKHAQIREAIVSNLGGNYFSADVEAIVEVMQQFPWVDEVSVRRQWPDTLMLHVTEHKPMARWGQNLWLTTKGELVELPIKKAKLLPNLSGSKEQLDLIYGQYKAWAPAFAQQGLRLTSVDLSQQHLWTLNVDVIGQGQQSSDAFEMVLLERNSSAQLKQFLTIVRQNLIDHPGLIERVDLRYSSGFSIKWRSQNAHASNSD